MHISTGHIWTIIDSKHTSTYVIDNFNKNIETIHTMFQLVLWSPQTFALVKNENEHIIGNATLLVFDCKV